VGQVMELSEMLYYLVFIPGLFAFIVVWIFQVVFALYDFGRNSGHLTKLMTPRQYYFIWFMVLLFGVFAKSVIEIPKRLWHNKWS
jgi:hypothetical protein